jgi:hypothetical protein
MDDDMEEEDSEEEEVELIFRDVVVDIPAFKFCCDGAVEGGGGGGRIVRFPLLTVVEGMLNPFRFIAPREDADILRVGDITLIRLVVLSSIQSADVGDVTLFEDVFPLTLFKILACPFKCTLLIKAEDFGGS